MTGRTCVIWQACSDKKRCDAYGSCVAHAQALNKADIATAHFPRSDETIKSDGWTPGAKTNNDAGYVDWPADGNQRNQTEERPAFEVRYRDFPDSDAYGVFASGRIEGFGVATVVVNRIPLLIAEAVGDAIVWERMRAARKLPGGGAIFGFGALLGFILGVFAVFVAMGPKLTP